MQLIEKINATMGTINPRYNLTSFEIEEIRNSTSDLFASISLAFRYGYLQGTKAAEAKLKEKPDHKPKYKNEIRQAIYYQVFNIKNSIALQEILQVSELFWKRFDEAEYKDLSNIEQGQCSIIRDILQCKDEKAIRNIRAFVNAHLNPARQAARQGGQVK